MEMQLALAAVATTDFVDRRRKQKIGDLREQLKALRAKMATLKEKGVHESKENERTAPVRKIHTHERQHAYRATRNPEYQAMKEQEIQLKAQLDALREDHKQHHAKKMAEIHARHKKRVQDRKNRKDQE